MDISDITCQKRQKERSDHSRPLLLRSKLPLVPEGARNLRQENVGRRGVSWRRGDWNAMIVRDSGPKEERAAIQGRADNRRLLG